MVTGAGRGIGRATVEAFVAAGWAVVIAELVPALGRRTERALRQIGAEALFVPTDVGDPAAAQRAVRAVQRRFGRLDCLVNNAGVLTAGPLARLPVRALTRMVTVNLLGPLLVSRAALAALQRARQASIVNVSSLLGKSGAADYVTYCATKFGVIGLTEALADELRGTRVRVWAVCPTMVDTAMARRAVGVSAAERAAEAIPPASVARVIVDLATGRRRAASGSALDVTR